LNLQSALLYALLSPKRASNLAQTRIEAVSGMQPIGDQIVGKGAVTWLLTLVTLMLCPALALAQSLSFECNLFEPPTVPCGTNTLKLSNPNFDLENSSDDVGPSSDPSMISPSVVIAPETETKQHFKWKRALVETAAFFGIEQAFVVQDDFHWVTIENGIPFNHYWRDYTHSLSTWASAGWDDGDSFLTNYIGHPMQGALTGYIQVQNDPQGEKLEFSMSKAYWWSRFKAMMWNAAYSTQWKIGPVSEMTVAKYGTAARSQWSRDGTWPCKKDCVSGVGQVDLVITPTAGLGWMVMEDALDRSLVRKVESSTSNRFLIDFTRCAVNPIRSGATMLHGRRPWYRASRPGGGMELPNPAR
jgi:hypothetical protein